ncbi:DNA replication/repair protein RecF [Candidatus Dependentiae bacterium]|nr:DNA replication/repair protein RecF [Candidatus Dependentiae bacterium]
MRILSVDLKHFRCFSSLHIDFNSSVVLLTGSNGAGKTSVLEALHYACYLKSFKTSVPKEMAQLGSTGFNATITIASDAVSLDMLSVSFAHNRRTVKINQKTVSSFKELYGLYKAITMTEEDLMLVKGSPNLRRTFLDQFLTLLDPAYALILRKYKQVLDNRNALLAHYKGDHESYLLWTEQLWHLSRILQNKRIELLHTLETQALSLSGPVLGAEYSIKLVYEYARPYTITTQKSGADFVFYYPALLERELYQKRTLFGAHLDDFTIEFQQKSSRIYASRGQQKLIVFLLKLAQVTMLNQRAHNSVVFLIDDFMTDLDTTKAAALLELLIPLAAQTVITSPVRHSFLEQELSKYNATHNEL